MIQLRSAKSPDLVKDAAEACSRGKGLDPSGRPIALFDAPMVLFNGLITHDNFCMSRMSPSRVRWVRRAPLRRAPPAMTDYLHNDSDHCAGSHETPMAHPASIPGGRGRRAAMGSGLPTRVHWSLLHDSPPTVAPRLSQRPREGSDENRCLCPRLDAAPKPGPDD
jgi:hypothetical protein